MQWAEQVIARKIKLLGQSVTIRGLDAEQTVQAVIDPVDSVSIGARTAQVLPDGYYPPGSYQYFGPVEGDLSEAETICTEDGVYIIRRKELYRVGKRKLYWWALLIRGGDGDA